MGLGVTRVGVPPGNVAKGAQPEMGQADHADANGANPVRPPEVVRGHGQGQNLVLRHAAKPPPAAPEKKKCCGMLLPRVPVHDQYGPNAECLQDTVWTDSREGWHHRDVV